MAFKNKSLAKIVWLLIAVLFFTGCEGLKVLTKSTEKGVYHTVLPGQTLESIARDYNTDVKTLQQANHIEDPSDIKAGDKLWIPGADKVIVAEEKQKILPGFLIWPVKGTLTSKFGFRRTRFHEGIDIGAGEGSDIVAAADGEVMYSGWAKGYGRIVIVKHAHHLTTLYAHNSKNIAKANTRVRRGQVIARVGQTGHATGPHLHFEVRNDTHPKDPLLYLP